MTAGSEDTGALEAGALARLFHQARTANRWQRRPVEKGTLEALYDLVRLCPTSVNSQPGRFVFVTSPEGRERLRPALSPGNVEKTMTAPVTVIVAHDLAFFETLPRTFPMADAKSWFSGNSAFAEQTAFRNGTLEAGYLILAARALGLDAGPMSGFDNAAVDREFFPDGRLKSNILVNLGYGDPEGLFPRLPRLDFDEACRFA